MKLWLFLACNKWLSWTILKQKHVNLILISIKSFILTTKNHKFFWNASNKSGKLQSEVYRSLHFCLQMQILWRWILWSIYHRMVICNWKKLIFLHPSFIIPFVFMTSTSKYIWSAFGVAVEAPLFQFVEHLQIVHKVIDYRIYL